MDKIRGMDKIRELITHKLAEKGLTMKAVSESLGRMKRICN
jgi:hypothetical protein